MTAEDHSYHQAFGIRIEDVTFSYGERAVLESINLSIPKGEIWALVGRSGIGKTTLLNIIAGLFKPSRGVVSILGRERIGLGRIRGIVFQDDCLLGWLSAKNNVLFPNHRSATAGASKEAIDMLDAVGLTSRYESYPNELSAGMRKRLDFARALIADKEYILADEPFGPVDALTRRDLWRLWLKLRERSPRTGILSTHDPEEAVRLCDMVVTLRSGPPSRITSLLKVPSHVKDLGITDQNDELWQLKDQIIQSLAE
jgi:ABC-type nitrate/sulfonate/bicarbonate transport system ATPase subunit